MDIRTLNTSDVFVVARMLSKVTGEAKNELSQIIKASSVETESKKKTVKDKDKLNKQLDDLYIEAGIKITFLLFQYLINYAADDLQKWLGSLIGKSPEEFGDMPPETTMEILVSLSEAKEIQSFFSAAFAIFNKMNRYAKVFGKK